MSEYLFIESRHASESANVQANLELAASLAKQGQKVTVFLVQNGVLTARKGAKNNQLSTAASAGVTLLADDFSLRERGIATDGLLDNVTPAPLDTVVDCLAAGAKTIWH